MKPIEAGPLDHARAPFGRLYELLAPREISPLEAEEMEVWQVASVLGLLSVDDEPGTAPTPGRVRSDVEDLERLRRGGVDAYVGGTALEDLPPVGTVVSG